MSAPTLRPYQKAALDAIVSAHQGGQNRLLVKKPTGTGKTVMFAAMPRWPALVAWLDQFPAGERKMLVVAHREELLDQAAAKIMAQNPNARVSVEQADRYASPHSDIVIASIQTLSATKFKRLKRLMHRHTFRLVIVDEAHHAAAATYRTALALLGFLPESDASDDDNVEAATYDDVAVMSAALAGWDQVAAKDRLLVGVTATPNRSDAIGLGCVFQSLAYSYDLKQAIADGWLVPIVPWVIETDVSLDAVKVNRGEFNQRELADTVNTKARNNLAVAGWHEYAYNLPTLAFTVDVAHAHTMAKTFTDAGVRAMALSGETPKEDRRIMLRQYLAGQITVITNCMVLTEGTDLPLTGCILHGKPTKSATLYEQMTGRGLRIHPGKKECIVIDIVDVARRHSLQAAPVLYGLPPTLSSQGKDLRDMAAAWDELAEKCPGIDITGAGMLTLEQLQARAQTFDVWTVPAMEEYGQGLTMKWLRVEDSVFKLSYPWGAPGTTETIVVEPDLIGKYQVSVSQRISSRVGERKTALHTTPKVIAAGVTTAREALRMAESFVASDRRTVVKLRDNSAPWRLRPASQKQIGLLTKMRAPIKPGLTMGEASDMIDVGMARRR